MSKVSIKSLDEVEITRMPDGVRGLVLKAGSSATVEHGESLELSGVLLPGCSRPGWAVKG